MLQCYFDTYSIENLPPSVDVIDIAMGCYDVIELKSVGDMGLDLKE